MLVRCDNRHHRIHNTMCRATRTQLKRTHTQRIAYGQRRILVQVLLQNTVRTFHPAQRVLRQTLRPRAILGRKTVQHPGAQQLGHQFTLAQYLVEQEYSGFTGRYAGV